MVEDEILLTLKDGNIDVGRVCSNGEGCRKSGDGSETESECNGDSMHCVRVLRVGLMG